MGGRIAGEERVPRKAMGPRGFPNFECSISAVCCSRSGSRIMLGTDDDPIVNLRYAWRRPGGPFCVLAFGPRPDSAPQDHLAAVGFDRDAACVDLSCSPQRLFDLAADFHGCDVGLDLDGV
jgi:hypothetical protein